MPVCRLFISTVDPGDHVEGKDNVLLVTIFEPHIQLAAELFHGTISPIRLFKACVKFASFHLHSKMKCRAKE
jgi:hypothetical protein